MTTIKTTDFEVVEPRFISIRPHGRLESDEAEAIMDAIEANVKGEPYFLFEVFMSDVDGVAPEARRVVAQRLQKLPDRALAVVGSNFGQRILAKLILTAVSMLTPNLQNTAEFFSDSDSARIWLRQYGVTRSAMNMKR